MVEGVAEGHTGTGKTPSPEALPPHPATPLEACLVGRVPSPAWEVVAPLTIVSCSWREGQLSRVCPPPTSTTSLLTLHSGS